MKPGVDLDGDLLERGGCGRQPGGAERGGVCLRVRRQGENARPAVHLVNTLATSFSAELSKETFLVPVVPARASPSARQAGAAGS